MMEKTFSCTQFFLIEILSIFLGFESFPLFSRAFPLPTRVGKYELCKWKLLKFMQLLFGRESARSFYRETQKNPRYVIDVTKHELILIHVNTTALDSVKRRELCMQPESIYVWRKRSSFVGWLDSASSFVRRANKTNDAESSLFALLMNA